MADFRALLFDDRAYENYRDEMDRVRDIEALLGEKGTEEIEEYREPLSLDERTELTILLSWGGPSDGIPPVGLGSLSTDPLFRRLGGPGESRQIT
jgi:hypothetical protein